MINMSLKITLTENEIKVAIQNYLLTLGYCQIPTHKSIDGVEVTLTQKFMETHIRAIVNVPLDYANKNIKLEE